MPDKSLNILHVPSSARREGSHSRRFAAALIEKLVAANPNARIAARDLADGVPFVDEDWVAANFTPAEKRTARQAAALAYSDGLIEELEAADVIVIGVPVYNFGVPASLKAWIDLIARARKTFQYTDKGPVGLLKNKRVILAVASGGTPVGSAADFATPYLKHILAFIGLDDVSIIAADAAAIDAADAETRALESLEATANALSATLSKAA